MLPRLKLSRKTAIRAGAASFVAAAVWAGHNYVGPDQFGLQETLGAVTSDIMPSGLHVNVPFFQYTHSYQLGLQSIEFRAGNCMFLTLCENTADQNALSSDIVINYRVTQDVERLSWHRWSMDGWMLPDGYWLLRQTAGDSANAVLGKRALAETVRDPKRYVAELFEDVNYRIDQNNIPVTIESIELKGFDTLLPVRATSYTRVERPAAKPPAPASAKTLTQ